MTDEEVVLEAVKIALDDVGIVCEVRNHRMRNAPETIPGLIIKLGARQREVGGTYYDQFLEAYIVDGVFHLTRTFLFLAPQWELCNPVFLDQLISVIRKESE